MITTISIYLGKGLIRMSQQINPQRRSAQITLKYIETLADLIVKNKRIPQITAFAELGLGVNESRRVHKGLLATKGQTIGFTKGWYFNKLALEQETLT